MENGEWSRESLEAVRALMTAVSQSRFYPPSHPSTAGAINSLAHNLTAILSRVPEWRLAIIGRRLTAGGEAVDVRPEAIRHLREDLGARGVDTILFRRGLEAAELRSFLALLAADPKSFAGAPIQERMAGAGIRFIEAGRLAFEDAGDAATGEAALEHVGEGAHEVRDRAIEYIQNAMQRVGDGQAMSPQEAEAFVESILRQMKESRSPYLMLTTLKSHHPYTFTHIIDVCILTMIQAEAVGVPGRRIRDFGLAAMLHDMGKSVMPEEILNKKGKLSPEEFAVIQRHPQEGAHILSRTPGAPDLAVIVALQHHMRYNNSGYPRLMRPRSLHPCSQMTSIADTYDAMRSRRSYQEEHPPERVAGVIARGAGTDFHPQLARAFLQTMGVYPPGTRVRLDTGEEALVIQPNPKDPYRPTVRLLRGSDDATIRRLEVVDLTKKEALGDRFERSVLGSITTASDAKMATQASN